MLKIEQVLRNENGDNVLNDYFETITIKGNLIIVKKEGLFGLYNAKTYRKILSCNWDKIVFSEKYILVCKHEKMGLYDYNSNVLLKVEWDKLIPYEKGILVVKNNMQGFFSYDGTPILDCKWKRIKPYSQVLLAYLGNGEKKIVYNYEGKRETN